MSRQILAYRLPLSQPEGAIVLPIVLHAYPALGSFLRPCNYQKSYLNM